MPTRIPPRSEKSKKRKDTVKKCKNRIQALLRELAIKLWKGCEARGIDQKCAGPLQADHIETRGFGNTYANIANIILLCWAHHFFWKRRNPLAWAALVEQTRGKEKVEWLRTESRKTTKTYSLKDWQAAEKKLKESLTLIH